MMEGCHQVRAINAILTSTAQCYNGYQKSHFMDNNILMIWFYVQYFNFIWFMKSCHAQESSIFCWNCLHSLKWMMNVWGGPLCCDGSVSWPCLESWVQADGRVKMSVVWTLEAAPLDAGLWDWWTLTWSDIKHAVSVHHQHATHQYQRFLWEGTGLRQLSQRQAFVGKWYFVSLERKQYPVGCHVWLAMHEENMFLVMMPITENKIKETLKKVSFLEHW